MNAPTMNPPRTWWGTEEQTNGDARLALDEMRRTFGATIEAAAALDRKGAALAGVAVLLLAAVMILQVVGLLAGLAGGLPLVPLAAALLAALWATRPASYRVPLAADWQTISETIIGRPEREALLALVSGYVEQVGHNEELNRQRGAACDVGAGLLLAGLLLLALMVIV